MLARVSGVCYERKGINKVAERGFFGGKLFASCSEEKVSPGSTWEHCASSTRDHSSLRHLARRNFHKRIFDRHLKHNIPTLFRGRKLPAIHHISSLPSLFLMHQSKINKNNRRPQGQRNATINRRRSQALPRNDGLSSRRSSSPVSTRASERNSQPASFSTESHAGTRFAILRKGDPGVNEDIFRSLGASEVLEERTPACKNHDALFENMRRELAAQKELVKAVQEENSTLQTENTRLYDENVAMRAKNRHHDVETRALRSKDRDQETTIKALKADNEVLRRGLRALSRQ